MWSTDAQESCSTQAFAIPPRMKKNFPAKDQNRPSEPRLNALEKLMEKSVTDSSHHRKLFKMLLISELFALIPPGEPVSDDGPKKWCSFEDSRGKFTPVFTSEAAAKARLGDVPELKVLAVEKFAADRLLRILSNSKTPVRIIAHGATQVTFQPEALTLLLAD